MAEFNYFNYFTEIEEYFWKKRGAHLLVSPLDWAIMETWQKAGIPVSIVLKGIDRAFESYQRSRRRAGKPLKSLAYCVDAVLDAAEEQQEATAGNGKGAANGPEADHEPFSREEIRAYVQRNLEKLGEASESARVHNSEIASCVEDIRGKLAESLTLLDSPASLDLEDLERRFTVLEEKLHSAATAAASEDALVSFRREVDRQLAPYRRKMTADQLAQVERQYLHKKLFEMFRLPRLSLFYLS
jgi:hypothetical protein